MAKRVLLITLLAIMILLIAGGSFILLGGYHLEPDSSNEIETTTVNGVNEIIYHLTI